ncbi:MAG: hypothetical protein IJJ24_10835 [Solobacterium sp.]|nr:hypothetical protein [Solobacterium sp.]
MILVSLGTNDKSFERLLKAVEKAMEDGTITDRVVVQAGFTDYHSERMEVFSSIPGEQFEKLMDEADLIITHGGAGTIMTALKKGKCILGAARLAKYHEHVNDHQIQLLTAFEEKGYLIYMHDLEKLPEYIRKAGDFTPQPFRSNTSVIVDYLNEWIEEN